MSERVENIVVFVHREKEDEFDGMTNFELNPGDTLFIKELDPEDGKANVAGVTYEDFFEEAPDES